jgi:3-isopropylmalate/(R)-2-methylmalate dehydratase large subunit
LRQGGRAGIIAPDQATFDYLNGREFAPKGKTWNKVLEYWKSLPTDPGAVFDTEIALDAENIEPMVSWGNTAEETLPISGFSS